MVPLYGHYRTRLHSLGGQQVRGLDSVQELVEFKLERDTETDGQRETWTEDVVAEEVLFCDSVPLQCDLWWDLH